MGVPTDMDGEGVPTDTVGVRCDSVGVCAVAVWVAADAVGVSGGCSVTVLVLGSDVLGEIVADVADGVADPVHCRSQPTARASPARHICSCCANVVMKSNGSLPMARQFSVQVPVPVPAAAVGWKSRNHERSTTVVATVGELSGECSHEPQIAVAVGTRGRHRTRVSAMVMVLVPGKK